MLKKPQKFLLEMGVSYIHFDIWSSLLPCSMYYYIPAYSLVPDIYQTIAIHSHSHGTNYITLEHGQEVLIRLCFLISHTLIIL